MSRRLIALPVDGPAGASTRQRVLMFREALTEIGFDVDVRFPTDAGRRGFSRTWRRLRDGWRDAALAREASTVLVHRKTYPGPLADRLAARARRLAFDFDDAIDRPPPSRTPDPRIVAHYRARFRRMIDAADLCICGNRTLAAMVGERPHVVVPTAVDTDRFRPGAVAPPAGPSVGWVGHSDNLRYLEALTEPLKALADAHRGFELVVVADRPPVLPGVPVTFRRWSLDRELEDFGGFAVGLMPLADDEWTRSKCAFKALQYMALGIPTVLSPVGANAEAVEHGRDGLHASDPREWFTSIDGLLRHPERAAALGRSGRARVEERYSASRIGPVLARILDALDREPAARRRSGRGSQLAHQ